MEIPKPAPAPPNKIMKDWLGTLVETPESKAMHEEYQKDMMDFYSKSKPEQDRLRKKWQ